MRLASKLSRRTANLRACEPAAARLGSTGLTRALRQTCEVDATPTTTHFVKQINHLRKWNLAPGRVSPTGNLVKPNRDNRCSSWAPSRRHFHEKMPLARPCV